MKAFLVLTVLLLGTLTVLPAQGVFLTIDDTRPYNELYMFPAYMSGTIQFEDGTAFTGQLNILLASSTLCFLDEEGHFFDTTHFPQCLKKYPFGGNGVYLIEGKVVEDYGFPGIEVEKMAKLPIYPDPRMG